jgi:hypothetical protein
MSDKAQLQCQIAQMVNAAKKFVRNNSDDELVKLLSGWAEEQIKAQRPAVTRRGWKKQMSKMLLYQFAMIGLFHIMGEA